MKVPHQDWGCSLSTHPVFNFHITVTGDPSERMVSWKMTFKQSKPVYYNPQLMHINFRLQSQILYYPYMNIVSMLQCHVAVLRGTNPTTARLD